jgi:flagellin
MTVINTNVASLASQNAMIKNNRDLSSSMQNLATGKRINSGSDDAAGLAISTRMTSTIRGLDQAIRNANDGISLIQTAEGALVEVTNMMQRMREISVQAANDTYSDVDRGYLDLEFQQLKSEINRVSQNTEWNGIPILSHSPSNNGNFGFQVGSKTGQKIDVLIPDFSLNPVVVTTGLIDRNKQFSSQVFSFGAGIWAYSNVSLFNENEFYSTNINTGSYPTSQQAAASYLYDELINGALRNDYNFTNNGTSITVTPSNSNTNPKLLSFDVVRAQGSQAELSLQINWADGTNSLNVTAQDLGVSIQSPSITTPGGLSSLNSSNILTEAGATQAITDLDDAIAVVSAGRASLGAQINRLTYAADNLSNISLNTNASRSRILDSNYAKESSELARAQIIEQAAMAMLTQANQNPQSVLQLLK